MLSRRLAAAVLCGAILFSLGGCGIQAIPKGQNSVEAAWAEVISQYKRRADLIPNLVEVVKKYASHEKDTLTAVIEARSKATATTIDAGNLTPEKMRQFEQASAGLQGALSRLMIVAEKYPDLKANENFRDLQAQLEGTENRITVARQRYIETVRVFNNLVTVVPTSWTNSLFYHFEKKPQFTVENEKAISDAPKVNF